MPQGLPPRLTQLCAEHLVKRKKLHEQAVRAGKISDLEEMERNVRDSQHHLIIDDGW